MDYDVIANQPVVIDNGSGVIKAGFAGEATPKCKFPNFVGRVKHKRVMAGALEGDIFVGRTVNQSARLICPFRSRCGRAPRPAHAQVPDGARRRHGLGGHAARLAVRLRREAAPGKH